MNSSRELRRAFLRALLVGIRVVWPVLSLIIFTIAGLGIAVGWIEGWTIGESLYFAFVTGLTIGFGDLVPESLLARALAVLIGLCGILLTALVAAVAVKALTLTIQMPEKQGTPQQARGKDE